MVKSLEVHAAASLHVAKKTNFPTSMSLSNHYSWRALQIGYFDQQDRRNRNLSQQSGVKMIGLIQYLFFTCLYSLLTLSQEMPS